MATVTVLMFPTVGGANQALDQIHELQRQQLITLHDAALVYWPVGQKSPSTRQLVDSASAGTVAGMLVGVLVGAIFFMPLLGMAVGTVIGAVGGTFRDHGIDAGFINRVRGQVTEGTSALFLMTSSAVLDRVADAMKHLKFEIISTNLSEEQEQKLREAFGQEQARAKENSDDGR